MPDPELSEVAQVACGQLGAAFKGKVGAGAFKETFAVVLSDGSTVAMKVHKPGFSAERTQREIDAMVRCSHPNIGGIISLGTVGLGGKSYLVSTEPFLPGGTLTSRVEDAGLLGPREAHRIGMHLIDAVGHIASHRLVHRDLKPDNILFAADLATPVIVDFGLVRDLQQGSLTQTWLMRGPGTPLFAPPEQLNNEKQMIDWRSDQFSLGVLLTICTFGFHPYQDDGVPPEVFIDRVAERKPQAERFVAIATETGLTPLIRMTLPWPVQRYQDPDTLADDWRRCEGALV